jgi:hypothetical protein
MTVHFIGAGPGAADLITVRGRDLLSRCPVCIYAGSVVPPELLAHCPPGARVIDSAPLSLDRLEQLYVEMHAAGLDVARLHSGDLSIYSALAEQLRRLKRHGISFTLTPGVPAFAAAAAAIERELTIPGLTQSVVLSRRLKHSLTSPPAAPRWRSTWPCTRWMQSSSNYVRTTARTVPSPWSCGPAGRTRKCCVAHSEIFGPCWHNSRWSARPSCWSASPCRLNTLMRVHCTRPIINGASAMSSNYCSTACVD